MPRPSKPNPDQGAILARVSRLHLGWKRYVQRRLVPFGVTPKQFHVLRKLKESGHLLPSDVARMIHADRPTVSSMIRTMERAGWVQAESDSEDLRRRRLVLRPAGQRLLERIPSDRWRSGAMPVDPEACLNERERMQMYELLGRMCEFLEEKVGSGPASDQGDY
jgi:DNA-binding MarR family transcriptional regulator